MRVRSRLRTPSLLLGLLRSGLLGGRHLLREHLLHALLLLDEEGAHDAHLHALGAPRASVRAVDRALALLQPAVFDRPQGRDADEALLAIAAVRPLRPLLDDPRDQLPARRANRPDPVGLGVVRGVAAVDEARSTIVRRHRAGRLLVRDTNRAAWHEARSTIVR